MVGETEYSLGLDLSQPVWRAATARGDEVELLQVAPEQTSAAERVAAIWRRSAGSTGHDMRLHGSLGDIPPAEFEAAYYAQLATTG